MEKKSLSQQTADRLYTMIVVEHPRREAAQ